MTCRRDARYAKHAQDQKCAALAHTKPAFGEASDSAMLGKSAIAIHRCGVVWASREQDHRKTMAHSVLRSLAEVPIPAVATTIAGIGDIGQVAQRSAPERANEIHQSVLHGGSLYDEAIL